MKQRIDFALTAFLIACLFSTVGRTQTSFSFTGGAQTYVVPAGVSSINVTVRGAQGGSGLVTNGLAGAGGTGSMVQGTLAVTSGQTLYLFVGSAGSTAAGASGGFNGGGNGSYGYGPGSIYYSGGGGGGASDIRVGGTALSNRVVVAAGGGGGGGGLYGGGTGGQGGATTGQTGSPGTNSTYTGGSGATQNSGGTSGTSANGAQGGGSGNFGQGGYGAIGAGGGGGGFYGGGGGGGTSTGGYAYFSSGGGGGSSNASTSLTSNVTISQGGNSGNGSITVSIAATPPSAVTQAAGQITASAATLYGLVTDNGATTLISFVYGTDPALATNTTTVSGSPASINAGAGATAVSTQVNGLTSGTTYYQRIKAFTVSDTTFGSILSFTTVNATSIESDIDRHSAAITVFPNPAKHVLFVEASDRIEIGVFSLTGRELLARRGPGCLDISNVAPGLYLIKAFDQNGRVVATRKLTKTGDW